MVIGLYDFLCRIPSCTKDCGKVGVFVQSRVLRYFVHYETTIDDEADPSGGGSASWFTVRLKCQVEHCHIEYTRFPAAGRHTDNVVEPFRRSPLRPAAAAI